MNVLDSERIGDLLLSSGWKPANKESEANLILFNTCCVRQSAEDRALGRLTLLKPWRIEKHERILALCGCIAQKDGTQLLERFPFLDLAVGTRDYHRLPQLLEQVKGEGSRVAATRGIDEHRQPLPVPRRSRGINAFVTIMYGCDNFCSYCIVPHVRGREVSKSSREIAHEVEQLVHVGVRELTLLGQNVNSFRDPDTGADFPDLLKIVNDVPGIARIRYTTSHPKDASEKLVRAVRNLDHVCENFHIPVQAGSDSVLERMNRGYTRQNYLDLVRTIREIVPDAVITTDLLVGFPGETDEDFEHTLELCRKVRWNAAFMFIYSVRPGTEAEKWGDDVPLEKKKSRIAELIRVQEKISSETNARMAGKTVEVLVEGPSRRNPLQLAGRERGGRMVVFTGGECLPGDIKNVRIVRTTAHTLIGEEIGSGNLRVHPILTRENR